MIELAREHALEARDAVLELHVLAGEAGELLGHEERLREEALDSAGPAYHQLVVLGKLVPAADRDAVLQRRVALQSALHADGDVVVPLPHELGIEDPARAVEGVYRG